MSRRSGLAHALLVSIGLVALQAEAQAPVSAPAPSVAPRVGTFKQVQGVVMAGPVGTQRRAFVGQGIAAHDRIATEPGGAATLVLRDGTVLAIGSATTLDLPDLAFEPTAQDGQMTVGVLQGTLRMVTGWLGHIHPEQVRVVTPTSLVGVRGTDFVVEVP